MSTTEYKVGDIVDREDAKMLPGDTWVIQLREGTDEPWASNPDGVNPRGDRSGVTWPVLQVKNAGHFAMGTRRLLVVHVSPYEPKVGDVIETRERVDSLPTGAIVLDSDADACRRVSSGWGWESIDSGRPVLPATIVYLPDAAAPAA